jgi:GT2 family glycosyltransferase
VVVVTWNSAKHVCACIDSVKGQSYPEVVLVVVDNGSDDGSVDMVKEKYPGTILIENTSNAGYCGALNQGIRKEASQFVLCLNADVRLRRDYVERAVETLLALPECGMLSGKILRPDGKTLDSAGQFLGRERRPRERGYGRADRGQYERMELVFSVCGAAAFYRRKMLDQIAFDGQYFDESYFAFHEDLDVGWRAQLAGWRCVYEPRAVAFHERGGTASPERRSLLLRGRQFTRRPLGIKYHIVKNRYMTIAKNDILESALADALVILAFEILLWLAVVATSPALLLFIPSMVRETLRAGRRRRAARQRSTASWHMIRNWIV